MSALNNNSLGLWLLFVVPGMVSYYFMSRFISYSNRSFESKIQNYFVLTILYLCLPASFLKIDSFIYNNEFSKVNFILYTFIYPMIFGVMVGLLVKIDPFGRFFQFIEKYNWLRRLGFRNYINPIDSSWEYIFSNMVQQYVIVTLKNNEKYAGYLGERSFASSSGVRRDLFIDNLYTLDCNDKWTYSDGHSILIGEDQIVSVEFFHTTAEEVTDER